MHRSLEGNRINSANNIANRDCYTMASLSGRNITFSDAPGANLRLNSRAILPVVVWYLFLPPLAGMSGVNTMAPVSAWSRAATYDTENDCMTAKSNLAASVTGLNNVGQNRAQNTLAVELSRCIASDDYRLEVSQDGDSQSSPGQNSANGWQGMPGVHP